MPVPFPYSLARPWLVSRDAPPEPDGELPSVEAPLRVSLERMRRSAEKALRETDERNRKWEEHLAALEAERNAAEEADGKGKRGGGRRK